MSASRTAGDVVLALLVLQKDGLTKQIRQRDPESAGDLCEDVKPAHLPPSTLDGADPLLRPANERPEGGLSKAASPAVEGDALANTELISCSPHGDILPVTSDVCAYESLVGKGKPPAATSHGRPRSMMSAATRSAAFVQVN
jgi:hypothetical protein